MRTFAQALMKSGKVERMSNTIRDPAKTITIEAGSKNAPIPAAESIAQKIKPNVPTRPITVAMSIVFTQLQLEFGSLSETRAVIIG